VHLAEAHAFLGAIGATEKLRMFENRLSLAGLDWAELARWKDDATAQATGLRWEIHAGRVPPDRLAQLMGPFSQLVGDMPRGALAGPPLRFELQGHLSWYEELDRTGGDHLVVMLLDGDEVAAVCNAHWDARFGERVHQALTAVARRWRGRGLAKGVKAAMLQLVQARCPQARTIITSNAEMNGPILAINQRLGFVTHRRHGHYQIDLQTLRNFLSRPPKASPRASEC
jgi:GNAT superfamily N-acetyltransferase